MPEAPESTPTAETPATTEEAPVNAGTILLRTLAELAARHAPPETEPDPAADVPGLLESMRGGAR